MDSVKKLNDYVIGIDIGATKSHCALFSTSGNLIDLCHWGPLNHEILPGSFAQFEDELRQFIVSSLVKNNIEIQQIAYSVFGVAGVDTKKQHHIVSEIIKNIGLKQITLLNDGFLGITAGIPSGTGICANNGTGCTLAGINNKGNMLQIGGVGFISSDYGGGGFLGEKIISAVYSELFRKGEKTCMTDILFKKLGIHDKHDFVEKIYEKIDDNSFQVKSCVKFLFEAVSKNDNIAKNIVLNIAESYANGITCMIEELQFSREENVNIVFTGSVFVKSEDPLMLNTLKKKVNMDNQGYSINYTLLDLPPVAGAVIWALNSLDSNQKYFNKVTSQFSN